MNMNMNMNDTGHKALYNVRCHYATRPIFQLNKHNTDANGTDNKLGSRQHATAKYRSAHTSRQGPLHDLAADRLRGGRRGARQAQQRRVTVTAPRAH